MSTYPEPPGVPNPYLRDSIREHGMESQYPPPPEGDERHVRAYHQRGASSGSGHIPAMLPYRHPQDPQYPPPPLHHNGYPPDPRILRDPYAHQGQPNPYREERCYPQGYNRGVPPPPPPPPQQLHQPQPQQQQPVPYTQSAPRQRTAIACRYCRRRKIRCSGFDHNPEGRCANCQRFQQECIFTPVSSQAQAFVPAHAVYPHMRGMQVGPDGRARQTSSGQQPQAQIYGAHGQPLGPLPPQMQHPPHPQQVLFADYPMTSPTGSYGGFKDENQTIRKRPQDSPHQPILPPPMPGQPYPRPESGNRRPPVDAQVQDERHHLAPLTPTSQESRGPPPASNYSPGSSSSSNSGLHPPQAHLVSTSPGRDNASNNRQDPMSLRSIVDNKRPETDIDRNMLGRLDRKN